MAVDHNNPQSRAEEILIATIDGNEYDKLPQSRLEELLLELKEVIEAGGGGGGTTNYNLLSNLPKINNVTVKGEMTASDLSLVLAEVGKGLSTNDYSDEEKAKVANLLTAIQGILTGTDLDSFGDVETALASKVDKVTGKGLSTNDFTDEYKAAIGSNTSAITAIKDGATLDSFGDVEVALLDKADTSDLGTAAAKDSTNSVTSGSTDLVESGAVKDAIDAAVAAAYHHAGTKTVAQLTHDLLIKANEGNVYNITDSGTTTSDFIEGIGKQIDAGDNVGICKVGNVYMFDLLSGLEDTSGFVQKSQTSGLLKNDGTVNTTIEDTVAGHTTAIAGKQDKYDTITYAQWQAMTPEQQAAKDYYISDYPSSVLTAGNIAYDNTTSGMAANKVQGAIDELKSGLTNYQAQNDLNLEVPNRVNLIESLQDAYFETNGVISASNIRVSTSKIIKIPKGTYTASAVSSVSGKTVEIVVSQWENDKTDGTNTRISVSAWASSAYTFTVNNDSYVSVTCRYSDGSTTSKNDFSVQLELGSIATAYTPYIPSVESRIEAVESGTVLKTVNVSPVAGHGITVDDGGVYRVGDLVIVQIKFTTTDATTDFFYGLPHPKQIGSTTLINLLSGDGTLFNVNASGFLRSASRQAGTYSCTGVYVTNAS